MPASSKVPTKRSWPTSMPLMKETSASDVGDRRGGNVGIAEDDVGLSGGIDVVDDADDHRAHRPVLRIEHLPRAVAFVEDEHLLVRAGADGVDGDEVAAVVLFDHEQAFAFVESMLDRAVHFADDASENHAVMCTPRSEERRVGKE